LVPSGSFDHAKAGLNDLPSQVESTPSCESTDPGLVTANVVVVGEIDAVGEIDVVGEAVMVGDEDAHPEAVAHSAAALANNASLTRVVVVMTKSHPNLFSRLHSWNVEARFLT